MYTYADFDRRFVRARAAQYRDQLERHMSGELSAEDFRPLRLQNGWYLQRHAPMLRVAIPYGVLSATQLRQLARIAREHDRQDAGQPTERGGFGHFTTRQNIQFNWIPLERSADVMDLLAEVDMHGIQTSGNCIRNITTDALAGVAPDEVVDPRPWCEILRQWSTLHPEFAFLPRKFKIAVSGAREDRAAIGWHDIGLQIERDAAGEVGFRVFVGGGMGRTPVIATQVADFVPWPDLLLFLEAVLRVYNRFGRRDNIYKARIKILVRSEGEAFIQAVHDEYRAIAAQGEGWVAKPLSTALRDRIAAHFAAPAAAVPLPDPPAQPGWQAAPPAFGHWRARNVQAHRLPGWRAVTLSLKRAGLPPGDVTADQMDAVAQLAERFSLGELRVGHDQNLVLPWVRASDLLALWEAATDLGLARASVGLLTDMIACPGGDLCALANARSLPIAAAIMERWADLDELHDIGDVDLHISGCINSCGHHHSGHIGILGVDKDGSEWYQITLGGSDGSVRSGPAGAGRVIGPAFAADEVPDALEAVIETYRQRRQPGETFVDAVRRLGVAPFRSAADAVRRTTARVAEVV
jgi:sulfite reductase (NADPH) hemoprotein beta-component